MPQLGAVGRALPVRRQPARPLPGAARLSERIAGLSAQRTLPQWRGDTFLSQPGGDRPRPVDAPDVVLLVDTFNNYFEPENAHAALRVLQAAGYRVHVARAAASDAERDRPLCCGRTYLGAGLVDEAKREARRMVEALAPYVARGATVVGLEPSCLLSLRDEFLVMGLGDAAREAVGARADDRGVPRARGDGGPAEAAAASALPQKRALLHGHCHQKAFDAMPPVVAVLKLIPGLQVEVIESSCCGMAGSFGYEAAHYDVSMKMAELSLLPAVRAGGRGHADRRRRHQLPAPDRRRPRATGRAKRCTWRACWRRRSHERARPLRSAHPGARSAEGSPVNSDL